MVNWRVNINAPLKFYLEKVIRDSAQYKRAISVAKDKKTVQLWISNAQLSKELYESKVRIKYLESILVDLLESKKKRTKSKKQKEDFDKLIKTLKKF